MSQSGLPASVRKIFQDPAAVRPASVCLDYGTSGSSARPVEYPTADGLAVENRFGLEAQLNALAGLLADLETSRPELWQAIDQAWLLLDGMQRLLNQS